MKARNYSLDLLKGIAAIFVVFIHVKFPGALGDYVAAIGAFAVPVFFMVSGYFAFGANRHKLKNSIIHILKLIGIAYAINLIRIFVQSDFSVVEFLETLKESVFNVKHLVLWLLMNNTAISGVAWFLFALLYCYLFCFIFNKFFNSKYIYVVGLFGFLGGIFAQIILPLLGYGSLGINNFWLCGIPYFLAGTFIRDNWAFIENKIKVIPDCIVAFLGLLIVTAGHFCNNGIWYVGNILLVISLFTLCIKYPNGNVSWLCRLGNEYSFYIYIMHAIFMHIFDALFTSSYVILNWTRPLIVLLITVVTAVAFYGCIKVIKGISKEKNNKT